MSTYAPRSFVGFLTLLLSLQPVLAAVTTIAVGLVFFIKLGKIRRGNRIDQNAKDKRNPDALIHESTTAIRSQLADNSFSEQSHGGIWVSRTPHTPILMDSAALEHSSAKAMDEDILTSIHTPAIALEHPSNECGDAVTVQNRKAGDTGCSGFPIPIAAPPSVMDSSDSNNGDTDTQGQESNTNCSALIGTANFTGGGHAFGSNSIVNNALMIVRSGDGEFTEVERNSISDYIVNHAVLPSINDNFNRRFLTQSIIDLPRAEAVYNDYQTQKKCGPCFEGTRVTLLREMADWVTGPDEPRMYVLSGLAGVGKSTIAYTIASRAADLNLLAASFFFSRDEVDRKSAKKFFTTLAYQLCLYDDTFAKAIGEVLQTERGSAAITKGPYEQLQILIVEPLRSVVQSRVRPILIVVDALDECNEEDEPSVLNGLRQLVRNLPSFKVILTTRPHLDHLFGSQDGHQIFRLQDIEDQVVDSDIRLYLKHSLSLEQVRIYHPTRHWTASDAEIDSLVDAAGRLFIIASTSVRFIFTKGACNPAAQMQKLLHAFAQGQTAFKDLNEFYTIILRNVVPVDCDDDIVDCYQSIIGAIIFIQHPLPVTTLAHLINIDAEEIRAVLVNLQSVIILGDDDIPRIYHKSFPDYITDFKRCQDPKLHLDPIIRHTQIMIRCFETMKKYLKYNILGLGDPARFMSNKDGLAKDGITNEQLEENIPQQLRYACAYWGNHIGIANVEDVALRNELELFANKHMLHWFEALSLIEMLDSAHRAIRVILKLLKPPSSDLLQLLSDGLHFISKFYELIERSGLHTYYTALPFTPTNTLLYRRYIKEASHNVCDVIGGPDNWDALVANLSQKSVERIEFSPDSTLFVSWAGDAYVKKQSNHGFKGRSELKVWDATTGTPVSTINGSGFAIFNDFSKIASFQQNTISFYNLNGSEQGAALTTRADVLQVAMFKSERTSRIAAALSDGTVCLWDGGNGEFLGSFGDYEMPLDSDGHRLEFSATGGHLAYTSSNQTVKLRDGIDGRLIANLDCGSSGSHDFAFSRNGSRIATWSHDLKLWSCEDGELIGIAEDAGSCLAISADGSLLVTEHHEEMRLWSGNWNPLTLVEELDLDHELDDDWFSATFSLDGILAIATESSNICLYNVKTRSSMYSLPLRGTTSLAFSPDCSHLAAANCYGSLYLWDLRGVEASNIVSAEQQKGLVTSLALSLDCSQLVYGLEDGTVELWETGSPPRQLNAIRGHHRKMVCTLGFSPDSKRFASGSNDGTINLWDGQSGVLHGTLQYPPPSPSSQVVVVVSNTVAAAAAGNNDLVLWDCETLGRIHTLTGHYWPAPSFSANGALLAAARCRDYIHNETIVFDVTKGTIIATFNVTGYLMAFLPDNSQLLVQRSSRGDPEVIAFDLANATRTEGSTFEHFVQLCNMPIWHGAPISMKHKDWQTRLEALFPQHNGRVPVLWIPEEFGVWKWAYGRSMIALGSKNGQIILLRPCTSQRK